MVKVVYILITTKQYLTELHIIKLLMMEVVNIADVQILLQLIIIQEQQQIIDDGSCQYCSDPAAANYDGADPVECAATDIVAGGAGTVGIAACMYYACTLSLTVPFRTSSTIGLRTLTSNCSGINSSTGPLNGTQNILPDHYEIEYQLPVGTSWDPNTGAIASFTYDPTTSQDAPPYNSGDFNITGLSACTHYAVRIRGVSNSTGGGTMYTPWDYAVGFTDCTGPGCTDGTGVNNNILPGGWAACNYQVWATVDDGSCEYDTCSGCMDQTYLEYCNIKIT